MSFMSKSMIERWELDAFDTKTMFACSAETEELNNKYFIQTSTHPLGSNYNIYTDFKQLMEHTRVGKYRQNIKEDGVNAIYIILDTMADLELLYRLVDHKPLQIDFYEHIITIIDKKEK